MSDTIRELAESLEDYGTSRANFRAASSSERYNVARWLFIAQSQVNASNAPEDKTCGKYGGELMEKKNRYYHSCGRAGIGAKEANAIWWSFVYGGAIPAEREKLV